MILAVEFGLNTTNFDVYQYLHLVMSTFPIIQHLSKDRHGRDRMVVGFIGAVIIW
jgi:hypothetical protein